MNSSSAPYLAADKLPLTPEQKAIADAESRQKELYQQMRQVCVNTFLNIKDSRYTVIFINYICFQF